MKHCRTIDPAVAETAIHIAASAASESTNLKALIASQPFVARVNINLQHALRTLATACLAASLSLAAASAQSSDPKANEVAWTGSWASAQMALSPQEVLPPEDFKDSTLRQIVHLSLGGDQFRLHLSNQFGNRACPIAQIHVARALSSAGSAIDATSDRLVTFHGSPEATIPPGAEYISDPIKLSLPAGADVAISLPLQNTCQGSTGHPGSRTTSYIAEGNQLAAATITAKHTVDHWYLISAIDVAAPKSSYAIAVLGDSITDGYGTTTNKNNRWTDVLAERLRTASRPLGVLNLGIGGNHLLTDGLGQSALARFDRDVLAQSGVKTVLLLEGVNDLGGLTFKGDKTPAEHAAYVDRIIGSYEQIIARSHAHGLKIVGATILPFTGSDYYHPPAATEADRVAINAWIRTPGHFDAVIDFDALAADPKDPAHLIPAYDCGDHLHPSVAGYRAMGELVPLSLFQK